MLDQAQNNLAHDKYNNKLQTNHILFILAYISLKLFFLFCHTNYLTGMVTFNKYNKYQRRKILGDYQCVTSGINGHAQIETSTLHNLAGLLLHKH
jgi:hypothetical protein